VADELVNIGTFALQTGLSIPMLRCYHEIGVLEPASVDPDTVNELTQALAAHERAGW
jgi:DNA-binding transcriptional MerR regulator